MKKCNHKCVVTGRDYDLEAHHIENYATCEEKRSDLSNGVVMNKVVHRAFHVIYGFTDNTQAQLDEFIESYSY